MSYYFRDKPRFSEKLRGKTGDELFQELKQHLDDETTFEPSSRNTRDPFERHGAFPRGFPFDDQSFGRFGDIRSQLDNLASRHPEFAEHLLGPPWGDVPLHGTLRNRRRGSGNSHQGYPDEDARSQASGSSAASAASGASGVSSHGEPEQMHEHQEIPNKIPQYGLRNTVDIGQHHHNMDNAEKMNREQRSASAPPENRQQINEEIYHQHQPSHGNPRFISRVDITPQFNQQTDDKRFMQKPQQQQQPTMPQQQQQPQQQKTQQPQSNVRHIPIFVEGRDEPVIPKNIDEPTISARQQSPSSGYYSPQFDETPSKFHTAPHFQRPSAFNQHFGNRPRDWSPNFQDSFNDVFDHPNVRKVSQPSQSAPFRQSRQRQQYEKRPSQSEFNHSDSRTPPQFPSQPTAAPASQQQEVPEEPKRKIFTPKDPLEQVDLIQKEVNSLTEQIKLWNGNSKTDKQYIYLDEMLTRELIKLDDIETEGKDNVRQVRKNAIKSIQDSISLLESKVSSVQPINKSQSTEEQSIDENKIKEMNTASVSDVNSQDKETPIPLPAKPQSPTKDPAQVQLTPEQHQPNIPSNNQTMQLDETSNIQSVAPPTAETSAMQVEQIPAADVDTSQNTQENNQNKSETTESTDKDENNTTKSGKTPKKLKKTKKQPPISSEPIPLPAAEKNCLDVQ